jgi:hypothetical protein
MSTQARWPYLACLILDNDEKFLKSSKSHYPIKQIQKMDFFWNKHVEKYSLRPDGVGRVAQSV